MENEKIISAILEKVGNTDVSSQTVSQLVALNPVAEGSEPDDAYFERMAGVAKSVQGNINNVVSTKLKTQLEHKMEEFKKNYKPQELEAKSKPGASSDDLQAIRDELAALRKAQGEFEARERREIVSKSVKEGLKEKFKQSGVDVRDFFIDGAIGKLNIPTENADVAALVAEAEKHVVRDMKAAGIDTDGPISGNRTDGNGKSWLDKKFALKAAREGYAKKG